MTFTLVPGNVIGCNINAHREGWRGSICEQAASWNCGQEAQFREDYCDRRDPRCYHLHAFDPEGPFLIIPQSGIGWVLEATPKALDDQILLLWGHAFQEPHGVRSASNRLHHMYGLYRVQSVERRHIGPHPLYHVRPYPDGWAEFHELRIQRPYFQSAGGAYIKQVERRAIARVLDDAVAAAERDWTDPAHGKAKQRLTQFRDYLDEWLRVAGKQAQQHRSVSAPRARSIATSAAPDNNRAFRPYTKLLESKVVEEAVAPPQPKILPVSQPKPAPPDDGQLVETSMREVIVDRYGEDTLSAILVGSLTKSLVVLRGEPGVGKSTLALNLIDDPKRERTLVVPVSSTWRGREDLLGHINPINGCFEATNFTRFLVGAERAWDAGDKRNHLVVFEEFNLSQPEYWLSDILVRSQYPADNRAERTLELGGSKIVGMEDVDSSGVYLAPNVRFVATVNSDLTTRPLSPRVLDRIALIELTMDPRRALDLAELDLDDDMVGAVTDLSFLIRPKGASFSFRSALSLKRCLDNLEHLGIDEWSALDLVLLQEVLTKIRLLSGDPHDHQVVLQLGHWAETHGGNLRRCAGAIATWKELLEEGQDVTQA